MFPDQISGMGHWPHETSAVLPQAFLLGSCPTTQQKESRKRAHQFRNEVLSASALASPDLGHTATAVSKQTVRAVKKVTAVKSHVMQKLDLVSCPGFRHAEAAAAAVVCRGSI